MKLSKAEGFGLLPFLLFAQVCILIQDAATWGNTLSPYAIIAIDREFIGWFRTSEYLYNQRCIMYLHHYFNSENGPFLSISDLPSDEALKAFHKMIRFLTERDGEVYNPNDTKWEFVLNRHKLRRDLESEMRRRFIEKKGNAPREYPYYLILCPYDKKDKGLYAFYENSDYISIPVEDLDMNTVSFTYGDSFVQYYGAYEKPEIVYTYNEILEVIKENGWVTKDKSDWGFVEAQLWSDEQIYKYRKQRTK